MTKKYRRFTTEFKLQVCKMIVDQGLSVNSVCVDMGLNDTAVRRWVEQYKAEQLGGAGIGNPLTSEQQRIRQLEQQVRELKMDNDILKKATAFFRQFMPGGINQSWVADITYIRTRSGWVYLAAV
ncbi:transposase, partial [Pseudomonas japonica]